MLDLPRLVADDLAMLLATGIVLHRVMSFDKSARWGRNFAYILSISLSGVMIIHCYLNERIIHQATFVLMVIWVAARTARLIDKRISNPEKKRKLRRLSRSGAGMSELDLALNYIASITYAKETSC